jgi:ATP-dependent 26S proteasome regulatory subunit
MYPTSWQKTKSLVFKYFLNKEIETIEPGLNIKDAYEAILPFYPDTRLVKCQLSDKEGNQKIIFGLVRNNIFFRLDFNNGVIYTFNERFGINLNLETVIDYARFFFSFVRGRHGFFNILTAPEDIPVDKDEKKYAPNKPDISESLDFSCLTSDKRTETLTELVTPPKLKDQQNPDFFAIDVVILFKNNLFNSVVIIENNGMISLTDERVILENIPLQEQVPEIMIIEEAKEGPIKDNVSELLNEENKETTVNSRLALETICKTLLSEAILQSNKHIFFTSTNKESEIKNTFARFVNMVKNARPVVVFESKLPYFEMIIADMVIHSTGSTLRKIIPNLRGSQSTSIEIPSLFDGNLLVLPMHSFTGVSYENLVTHEITMTDSAVFIGCSSFQNLPESLRSLTDIILKIPDINATTFRKIFSELFSGQLDGLLNASSLGWTGMLLPNDIVQACRLNLGAEPSLKYLEERVNTRMKSVSPDQSPSLDDLHGLGEAKDIARDLIADIKMALEGSISWDQVDKGMLIIGPPGTGKTTLAKAIARECGVKFIVASASRWQSTEHLGQHIAAIMSDFALARRCAPSILFIDELDSVGSRNANDKNSFYSNMVVNTILQEIQGFSEKEKVIVIGATNLEQLVDPALKRAGRLERVMHVGYPTIDALAQIFNYYLNLQLENKEEENDIDNRELAALSFGLSGADIELIVRGAIRRARKENKQISQKHIIDEITGKPRDIANSRRITLEEMRRIAVHESGHALCQLLDPKNCDNIAYISIVPRSNNTLGFVVKIPSDSISYTRNDYIELLEVILAGRAAEEIIFGRDEISSGSGGNESSDLAKATHVAQDMIRKFGFGKNSGLYYSESPDNELKKEVKRLLESAYRSVLKKLKKNRPTLNRLIQVLIEKQEISGKELKHLLNN